MTGEGAGVEAAGTGMGCSMSPGTLWGRRARRARGRRVAVAESVFGCEGRSAEGSGLRVAGGTVGSGEATWVDGAPL